MRIDELEIHLQTTLREPLPGVEAQKRLCPRPRHGWQPGAPPDDCRTAAGLLLIHPVGERPAVLLTVRDDRLPQHAGQVSLPGGAVESNETIEQGALREAEEEVGVDTRQIRVLGRLTPLHIPVSKFVLHPVVAVTARSQDFRARDGEVRRVLRVPVERLGDRGNHAIETRTFRGEPFQVPYIGVDGEKVWGATAMILAEFLVLVGFAPDPWVPLPGA